VTGTGQWSAAATPFSAASNGSNLSVCCVTIRCMEVTARAVEAIPRGNLHVSRDEFVALWRLVEHLGETVSRGRVECILVFRASRSDAWVCYRRGADGPLGRRSGFRYGRCRLLWLLRAVPRVCRSSAFASASGSVAWAICRSRRCFQRVGSVSSWVPPVGRGSWGLMPLAARHTAISRTRASG
jgi:hypothetical protein